MERGGKKRKEEERRGKKRKEEERRGKKRKEEERRGKKKQQEATRRKQKSTSKGMSTLDGVKYPRRHTPPATLHTPPLHRTFGIDGVDGQPQFNQGGDHPRRPRFRRQVQARVPGVVLHPHPVPRVAHQRGDQGRRPANSLEGKVTSTPSVDVYLGQQYWVTRGKKTLTRWPRAGNWPNAAGSTPCRRCTVRGTAVGRPVGNRKIFQSVCTVNRTKV